MYKCFNHWMQCKARIVSSWCVAGGCRSAASRPLPLPMHKTVQKLCTIVQNVRREVYTDNAQISAKNVHNCAKNTQRCTCVQCPSSFTPPYTNCEHNYCTQIGIIHNCVHKVHKVVQNVQCHCVIPRNFPIHISLDPAHIGAST